MDYPISSNTIYPKSRNIYKGSTLQKVYMLLMVVKGWSRLHRLLKQSYPQKRDPRATDMISATSSGGWWTWFSPKSLSAPGGRCGTWWFQRTTYDIKALKHSKWSKIVHDTEYIHVTCWWRVLKIKSWYYLPGHSFFFGNGLVDFLVRYKAAFFFALGNTWLVCRALEELEVQSWRILKYSTGFPKRT